MKNLRAANVTMRFGNASLALGALVTYQLNALIYRPAEGRAETALLEVASQHIYDAKSSVSHPVMYKRGVYFLSDIVDDGVFRLPHVRRVSSGVLLDLYRRDFMEDIEAALIETPSQNTIPNTMPPRPHARQQTTKRRKTTSRVVYESSDDSISTDSEDVDIMATAPATMSTIPEIGGLSDLLHQFPSDLLQLVPKPKSAGEEPWFLLDKAEVARAKVGIFQSLDIHHVFRHAQCAMVDRADWQTTVFDRYFPRRNYQRPKSLQHFPSAAYYRKWENLMKEAIDDDAADAIRRTVSIWFSKLLWVPFPESDRMWSTRKVNGFEWRVIPSGEAVGLYPHLAINIDSCDKTVIAELWKI
jgi:hypothetical protein